MRKRYLLTFLFLVGLGPSISNTTPLPTDNDTVKQYLHNVITAWNKQNHFINAQYISFKYSPGLQESAIPLTLVVDENSGWKQSEVLEKFAMARDFFRDQCKIHFNPLLILRVQNRNGPVIDDTRPGRFIADMGLEESGMLLKPVFYFVQSEQTGDPSNGGQAYVRNNPSSSVEARVHNSGFLYRKGCMHPNLHYDEINAHKLGAFEILTHELGHILMQNEGHSQVPGNFMSEDAQRTNVMTPAQCDTMKQNIKAMKSQAEQRRAAYRDSSPIKSTSLK